MATTSWLPAARQLLPLALLALLAATSASAARPMLHAASSAAAAGITGATTSGSTLDSPHRAERKLFSWEGVTADQVIAGSVGKIDGPKDGEVAQKLVEIFMKAGYNVMMVKSEHRVEDGPDYAQVEVGHFWDNSEFTVYYKKGPFEVANTGDGGYENWTFGGNWQRVGADDEVVVFY